MIDETIVIETCNKVLEKNNNEEDTDWMND